MFKDKFFLAQAICEIRYQPELTYFDKRIRVCSKLRDILPEWDFNDRNFIRLANPEKNEFFETHCKRSAFWRFDVDEDDFQDRARKIFQLFTKEFRYQQLDRVGVRLKYFIEADLKFDDLKATFYNELFSQREEMAEKLFNSQIPDTGFAFDFEGEKLLFHLRFGPVHREEIKNKSEFKKLFLNKESIPDVAMFWDVDCYKHEIDRTEISDIINKALLETSRKIKVLTNLLKEKDQ